jgi:hypothetical protein
VILTKSLLSLEVNRQQSQNDLMSDSTRLLIGWREWVAFPKLKLPAVKAKVDTGAKTSALHAFSIEPFTERGILRVRFKVHPIQNRKDIVVVAEADVLDHRYISDSGGHREKRYVIETVLVVGPYEFPIEITLTNRESMAHRMLLGRSAMKYFMIDPSHNYLLGRPEKTVSAYRRRKTKKKKLGRS